MSSSTDEFTHKEERMFLLVSGGHICASQRDTNMAFPNLYKFGLDVFPNISHRPDSWRGFLYIYFLSFSRFWTFCIDWFTFSFIFDGVTVKTQRKERIKLLWCLKLLVRQKVYFKEWGLLHLARVKKVLWTEVSALLYNLTS